MGDVARALILPDLRSPKLQTARNLALYWDEIVCLTYKRRWESSIEDVLADEGVIQTLERDIPDEKVFPTREGFEVEDNWAYHFTRDSDGEIKVELGPSEGAVKQFPNLSDLSDADLESIAAIMLERHLSFVDDAFSIAGQNNLAPVSQSAAGHLAAVIGSSQEDKDTLPAKEAALLSVVIEAFAIDPAVSSEDVLAFRERHSRSQARLRGSLVDLASALRADGSPTAMLAEARDTYKNRVEPALGDLEEALKESQLKFFFKSLLGATAIAIAPIEPISTSVGAARVLGQSIDYSYSKSRLVREHPYGYLHEVSHQLGAGTSASRREVLAEHLKTPRKSLAEMWRGSWREAREFDRQKRLKQG